jgi:heat shock protein HspQ
MIVSPLNRPAALCPEHSQLSDSPHELQPAVRDFGFPFSPAAQPANRLTWLCNLFSIELTGVMSQIRSMDRLAIKKAKFSIGQVVRHRLFPFRGIIFDVDPEFANTDEWYEAIPVGVRPSKDQPFYHLLAENSETDYIAYVSEQNLVEDVSDEPVRHPQIRELFLKTPDGHYEPRYQVRH